MLAIDKVVHRETTDTCYTHSKQVTPAVRPCGLDCYQPYISSQPPPLTRPLSHLLLPLGTLPAPYRDVRVPANARPAAVAARASFAAAADAALGVLATWQHLGQHVQVRGDVAAVAHGVKGLVLQHAPPGGSGNGRSGARAAGGSTSRGGRNIGRRRGRGGRRLCKRSRGLRQELVDGVQGPEWGWGRVWGWGCWACGTTILAWRRVPRCKRCP